MEFPHQSVLLSEVLHGFSGLKLHTVVDATLGAGGHAEALLREHEEIDQFLGIDHDPDALAIASDRLKKWKNKMVFKHGNFDQIVGYLHESKLPAPDAILADLGVSSMQFDQPHRGFSLMQDGPLDMRMDPEIHLTAGEIVNHWSEKELGQIFRDYGEEKQWKKAARSVVAERHQSPFLTTLDLKNRLTPYLARHAKKGIHPCTLIFQALRICVNRELETLETFLPQAIDLLAPGGRLAVISFHSLEDRIVKNQFRFAASDKWETEGISGLFRDKTPLVKLITKKPIEPTAAEIARNPRSRSAKLRIVEKLGQQA